jgi:hypothetical protein
MVGAFSVRKGSAIVWRKWANGATQQIEPITRSEMREELREQTKEMATQNKDVDILIELKSMNSYLKGRADRGN